MSARITALAGIFLTLAAVLAAPAPARADTPWLGFTVDVFPRCRGERPLREQPVSQSLFLDFEKKFPSPSSANLHIPLPLGARRLAVVNGNVMLSDVPAAGEAPAWRTIGRVDLASMNCYWTKTTLKVQFVAGESATLHEVRGEQCTRQIEDDSVIELFGADYTKPTDFRVELSPGQGLDTLVLTGSGSSWYDSHWDCIRAHGDRVTTLR